MTPPIFQVDSFAREPFTGNPAAVCLLESQAAAGWMQRVAHEMNLSETAFVVRGDHAFGLRWFTPVTEVDLCGHATLAAAHVLWQEGWAEKASPVRFATNSGILGAHPAEGGAIELDFPAERAEFVEPDEVPGGLLEALNLESAGYIGRNRFDYLVEIASESGVRNLAPNFRALAAITMRGVIVTAPSEDPKYDFVSRFFAPGEGIDEDPVTGSAHCALGPHWGRRLRKEELLGYQASARGGAVGIRLDGERVRLRGHAVTVLRGRLAFEAERAPEGPAVRVPGSIAGG